ncbi:MAG: nuclear transport factor 2 family protein [Pseudomonadota bacterium]
MRAFFSALTLCCTVGLVPGTASVAIAEEAKQSDEEARIAAAAKVVQSLIDASRTGDLEKWLNHLDPDVTYIINDTVFIGRAELRKVHKTFLYDAKKIGLKLRAPEIFESGWTGDQIFIWQTEYFGDREAVTYSEYEVKGDKVATVVVRF